MTPDLVIYHGPECYDGFTAAWLLHDQFPEAEFLPANHGRTDPPDVTGRKVLIVDFSWPRGVMLRMAEQADEIVVLDHHKTAQEALEGLDFATFDMERSGCQLAFDWIVEQQGFDSRRGRSPWLVDHVADRDLWRMELPDTAAIHAYYTSVPMTFEDWSRLAVSDRQQVIRMGNAIRQSIDRYCEKVSKESEIYATHDARWGFVEVVNAPYLNASELAHYMLKTGSANVKWSAAWFRRGDGMYQYSLRSKGEFDVSEIAKHYGGGGHRNAAGFESDKTPDRLWTRE